MKEMGYLEQVEERKKVTKVTRKEREGVKLSVLGKK